MTQINSESSGAGSPVRRRKVFYIPGYDPIHPRRYRELYRKESAAQSEISGYEIALKPKKTTGPYGWHVEAKMEGQDIRSDVEVLVWSDIVRDSMSNTIPATYWQLVHTAWTYIGSGALRRLMWLRKGPVIAALYPVGMLLLQLAVAVFLAWLVALVVKLAGSFSGLPDNLFAGAGWLLGMSAAVAVLRWFRSHDNRLYAYYLMHDYAYSAALRGRNPDELEARIAEFTKLVREAMLDEDLDEVLVVGHSSGAHVGVSVLADLLRARVPRRRAKLAFLSLGQVVPMVSFLPEAQRLRADLAWLSTSERLTWIDVSAPGDGCAFALCDPVTVSGVASPGKRWPLVVSAAFTQTLSPERWKELRWKFFRLHFQYLCAFDQPGDYDYFRITAGPVSLEQRYEGRQPSRSRIDVPVSKFTSVAAA